MKRRQPFRATQKCGKWEGLAEKGASGTRRFDCGCNDVKKNKRERGQERGCNPAPVFRCPDVPLLSSRTFRHALSAEQELRDTEPPLFALRLAPFGTPLTLPNCTALLSR